MEPFRRLQAVAIPLDDANIDTGRIFPSRFLRRPRSAGYGNFLFRDARIDEQGNERPDFVMNRAAYRGARIIVADANFACGSSREPAVYALVDAGFRCVIAGAELGVDLETQTVHSPDGEVFAFDLAPSRRLRLLNGLDDAGLALACVHAIDAFERRHLEAWPWVRTK